MMASVVPPCVLALAAAMLGTVGAAIPAPPPPFVGPCSFSEGLDCSGQDMKKIPGDPKNMTQEQCCSLCKAEPGCKVAVLATDWQNGQNLCELKSGCDSPVTNMAHRVKCCLPGAPGSESCGGGGAPAWQCKKNTLPTFCDHAQPIDKRVAELVSKMTAQEKVDQVGSNGVPGIDRLGIPGYQWWGEAQHGVCQSPSVKFQPPTPYGTSFPEPGLTGATFDKELFSTVGEVIGQEGRAMANAGNAGLTFWAPNINIVRDPRWGRLLETPGEDPFLTSTYAIHFIKGVQGVDPSGRGYLRAAATPKHYAGYNFDSWHGMDRYHYNALISKQDWADTYSQPFQASVVGANASGLMCSYNALNGTPTCASSDLLTKLAREEYGFDGYITGDCGAAADVWTAHSYGGDAAGAAAASISAGMDVDCGNFVKQNGMAALNSSKLTMDALDTAVGHLFRLRIRLGYFDPPSTTPWGNASHADLNYTKHYAQALRAAQEGIVLLDHKRSVLPLQKGKTIAISGPNANNSANMQGIDCHGVPPYLVNPVDALKDYATVHYSEGCSMTKQDTSGFAAAAADASKSDAAVLVLGLDPTVEYEMRDRTDLLLPGVQAGLVAAVRKALGPSKPLVLVLMGGGVIDTAPVLPLVDAILWIGYPGQSGGTALAQVLFGEVIPSGRSPLTWYPNDYAADSSPTAVDALDMSMRPGPIVPQVGKGPYPPHGPNPGRTYRFYPGTTRYPFGYGATYGAEFNYKSMDLSVMQVKSADVIAVATATKAVHTRYNSASLLTATVTVTNVGTVAADHSVLLFASPPRAGVNGTQLHGLVGFERVHSLAPAASAKVIIPLTAWSLAVADEEGLWGTQAGIWKIHANNGTDRELGMQATGSSAAAKLTVV